MKIVYLHHGTHLHRGIERILCSKLNAFAQRDIDTYLVTTDQNGRRSAYDLLPNVKCIDLGINFFEINNSIEDKKERKNIYKEKISLYKRELDNIIIDIDPDIIIFNSDQDLAELDFSKYGKITIGENHMGRSYIFFDVKNNFRGIGLYLRLFKLHIKHWFYLNKIKKLDKYVVLTEEDCSLWGNLKNVCVIPNFSDIKYDESLSPDYSVKRVIAIGHLCDQKRFDSLISSWKIVNKRFPDWTLSIFGNGKLHCALQKQINALGLDTSVKLEGITNDVTAEYLKSSIYAMSSDYEGLPMVLLEAMKHKLPIVSYACPCGPKELVDNGRSGVIVDKVGDVFELASSLMMLMSSATLRQQMGEQAYLKSNIYNEDNVINKWVNLFNDLIENKNK